MVIILIKIGLPSHQMEAYNKQMNFDDLRVNLYLLKQIKEQT